jgi:hypothetical protein
LRAALVYILFGVHFELVASFRHHRTPAH